MKLALHITLCSISLLAMTADQAQAYTFKSGISRGCHESITLEALHRSGWPDRRTPPALRDAERLAVKDVPFDLPADMQNGWSLALVLGVRDPDVSNANPRDLLALAAVHSDPEGQASHCLRRSEDDYTMGDLSALRACQASILQDLERALNPTSDIETQLAATMAHEVSLVFRGRVTLDIAHYPFYLGRALHTLQDSFSHTFRSSDHLHVQHVLNWIDTTHASYAAERDGHAHVSAMDACSGGALINTRTQTATAASAALLTAMSDTTGGSEARLQRAQNVLASYLTLAPGCDASNAWCDAPERHQKPPGCQVDTSSSHPSWWLLSLLLGFCRRRLHISAFAIRTLTCTAIICTVVISTSALARAERTTWMQPGSVGAVARVGASLDREAVAYSGGVRVTLTERIAVGGEIEHNPWYSFDLAEFRGGTFNAFATGTYIWHQNSDLILTTTLGTGASLLLFDLVGANRGSLGPYFRINLLGVLLPISQRWHLIVDPADVVMPIPQTAGVPFYYLQYRFTVGIWWSP